jgi:hypothetical protein
MNISDVMRESEDSFKLMFRYIGRNTDANIMLLKYPDLIDAFLNDDKDKFNQDTMILICYPIKFLVEAYITKHSTAGVIQSSINIQELRDKIENIMGSVVNDPVIAKYKLKKILEEVK